MYLNWFIKKMFKFILYLYYKAQENMKIEIKAGMWRIEGKHKKWLWIGKVNPITGSKNDSKFV